MKVDDFIAKAKEVAASKTIYVYGTYGSPLTESLIAYKGKQYPGYNTAKRLQKYRSLLGQGYGAWDCVGLIKGILWGWAPNKSPKYASNGVPDVGANTCISRCLEVSTSFGSISPGEVVWMPGHIGVYVGDNQVAEATPSWADGVQLTKISGRGWQKHGKLPWVDYTAAAPEPKPGPGADTYTVIKGDSPWSIAAKLLGDGHRYVEIEKLNGLSGKYYIYAGQVLKMPTGSAPAPAPKLTRYQVTARTGLNYRASPSASGRKLGAFNFGQKVEIEKQQSGWGYVPAVKGWISMQYVKKV